MNRSRPGAPAAAPDRSPGPSRRPNALLVAGVLLVGMIVALAAFGPALAPRDPEARVRILRDAAGQWRTGPFAPLEMPGFPLGTDYDGRDVLSRLLGAFRPTVAIALAAGVLRLAVGTALGLGAGWLAGRWGRLAGAFVQGAAAVPLLIVAVAVLYLGGGERGIGAFVAALCATGWASTALVTSAVVAGIRGQPYVEAARAAGAGEATIVRRHVLPQLVELAPMRLAFEVGAALLALAELGFLGFYLGGGDTRSVARGDSSGAWQVIIAGAPDLAQMLSGGWQNFYQAPWLAVWGGGAFFLAVLAFMLLGEGLRAHLARRTPPP